MLAAVVWAMTCCTPALADDGPPLTGEIKVDGSSTVYLITEAMATYFKRLHPRVNLSIGISGTGGGFKKFASGEIDISDASRPIKKQEAEKCARQGIDFLELQVAWDGLAVIINKDNTWATKMTVAQLKKIWHPDSATFKNARTWKDVDPSWPEQPLQLYGPGPDSGTFDYFTEVINGKEKVCRLDYGASEDDNNVINGIISNKYALGYLGVAYYEAHKDKLQAVAVAAGQGKEYVLPSPENVLGRRYKPLGRPLFIYLKKDALQRPVVREFVQFYLRRSDLVAEVKYVPLSFRQQYNERQKLNAWLGKALAP